MANVKSKNSKVELLVFKFLRKKGIYFQKHYRKAPGSPDIALPGKKRAVFIDGDFWHGRTIKRVIANRGIDDFWTAKVMRNIERDKKHMMLLKAARWKVLRVWESDLTRKGTQEVTLEKIKIFLTQ